MKYGVCFILFIIIITTGFIGCSSIPGNIKRIEEGIVLGGGYADFGNSVQQTKDGGFIITGETESFGSGSSDVLLIKTDFEGNEIWHKVFGGESKDAGYSVQQTSDGGYIIAGCSFSFDTPGSDVYLIKTDIDGNEIWHRFFGGENNDAGHSVQQTSDGGYFIAATADNSANCYLIKTDENGIEEWSKIFPGSGYAAKQTSDGGYIVTGRASHDVLIVKMDAFGNEEWNNAIGGEKADLGRSIQQTSDCGYIIAGMTDSFGAGETDIYLIKTDSQGNEIWSKTFGGKSYDYGLSVVQTVDGGFIVTGYIWTSDFWSSGKDACLIKTDANGMEEWIRYFGGSDEDEGAAVLQASGGEYIIVGTTASFGIGIHGYWSYDIYFIKTDLSNNAD